MFVLQNENENIFLFILIKNKVMEFYEKLLLNKKKYKLTNVDLGFAVDMTPDQFRMAVKRESLSSLEIREIENLFDSREITAEQFENNNELKEPTGFYYPDVSAAAGMDKEIVNDELKRIPINLPNWEKGIDFINVYGDSMYPKYCSGEIIGIKEVELQYVNYGYAYVVILKDGQVLLKFIKKGIDNDHIILESENKFYEPKEYHLDQIKKVFIIKGVITKTTM